MTFPSLLNKSMIAFHVVFLPSSVIAHQVYFVASEMEDSVDKPDMINTQYLQRVMSVQRAIETANFTSAIDGQVSAGKGPRDGVVSSCYASVFSVLYANKKIPPVSYRSAIMIRAVDSPARIF